jgi:DUF4097 and DUF4098 domain-containing protein YvlB
MRSLTSLSVILFITTLFTGISLTVWSQEILVPDSVYSLEVGPSGTLHWTSDISAVEIRGTGNTTVEFRLEVSDDHQSQKRTEKYEGVVKFDVRVDVDQYYISVSFDSHEGSLWEEILGRYKSRPKFIIRVPEQFSININNAVGNITVSELGGDVKINTSVGSIGIQQIVGNVDVRSASGSVTAKRIHGNVSARTDAGSIEMVDIRGDIDAKTNAGKISIDDVSGAVDAVASVGAIDVIFTGQPLQRCTLESSAGKIYVGIKEGIALTLNAETAIGKIASDFPVFTEGDLLKSSVYGDINGGGPELLMRTSIGSIEIKKM